MSGRYQHLIFDLDETLYPRHAGVMDAIGNRIHLYLINHLSCSYEEAVRLRRRYYLEYGTALRGLQVEHHIDADEYLRFVHAVPLENYLEPDVALDAMLSRIPLRKAIFTNADSAHARRVMERLDVTHHFPVVIDIYGMGFQCKPNPEAYRRLLDVLGVPGQACIMVEDLARNLRPARELFGITTILVDGDQSDGVDHVIDNLFELEALVNRLICLNGQAGAK